MLDDNALIGGEGNGGVIDPRIVPGRDSLVGIAYVLQLMTATGKSISQLVEGTSPLRDCENQIRMPSRGRRPRRRGRQNTFASETDRHPGRHPHRLGDSWVHARPSNTEPIMRIIAEAPHARRRGKPHRRGTGSGQYYSDKSRLLDLLLIFGHDPVIAIVRHPSPSSGLRATVIF